MAVLRMAIPPRAAQVASPSTGRGIGSTVAHEGSIPRRHRRCALVVGKGGLAGEIDGVRCSLPLSHRERALEPRDVPRGRREEALQGGVRRRHFCVSLPLSVVLRAKAVATAIFPARTVTGVIIKLSATKIPAGRGGGAGGGGGCGCGGGGGGRHHPKRGALELRRSAAGNAIPVRIGYYCCRQLRAPPGGHRQARSRSRCGGIVGTAAVVAGSGSQSSRFFHVDPHVYARGSVFQSGINANALDAAFSPSLLSVCSRPPSSSAARSFICSWSSVCSRSSVCSCPSDWSRYSVCSRSSVCSWSSVCSFGSFDADFSPPQRELRWWNKGRNPDNESRSRDLPAVASTSSTGAGGRTSGVMPAKAFERAATLLRERDKLPSLVVVDLDYTVWPYWCECLPSRVHPHIYPDARGILEALHAAGVKLAVASRTPTPEIARVFLDKLKLTPLFADMQIYPSWTNKTEHFQKISRNTGIPYSEMLFFDDEDRNTITMSKLGVASILVDEGITLEALREGLDRFAAA
ncbi:hypothetical protein CBR_g26273 [Chara braunii]|uniref:Magnesium-dependent phosphatase-1 n=1 Tax=Chara braunii TaxID=69332 RepID=A0A388L7F2_CHABU|nr:hypothetical protein CBR_g26273 [Chara braunii]|eukprot:GBG78240.1 hypothetical protein CBR_g26273 [Chara braunii]